MIESNMATLPAGEVTFLFTDIVGSGRMLQDHPVRMRRVLRRHNELIQKVVGERQGLVIKQRAAGDSVFAVFTSACDAIHAGLEIQLAMSDEPWEGDLRPLLRIAIHTGAATPEDGDYIHPVVNQCSYLVARTRGTEVLLSESTRQAAQGSLPVDCSLVDLGTLRLKHAIPLHVHRLQHPQLPESTGAREQGLPQEIGRFIGRERELRAIESAIDDNPLVSIVGSGGVGKTRLALRVAYRSPEAFRDRAVWIELAHVGGLPDMLTALADSLELEEDAERPFQDVLMEALRSRHLLLVLDNAEHVIDIAAPFVAELMRQCADLRVLVTSRSPLCVPGERLVRLPPMSHPEGKSSSAEFDSRHLLSYEAIELFVDRARMRCDTFRLHKANAGWVSSICSRMEGHALAIELAAAHVGVLSLAVIDQQVRDCMTNPLSRRSGGDQRHATLQAALNWSYELLTPTEQTLFEALGVFAGGFDLPASAAVQSGEAIPLTQAGSMVTDMVGLVDKSMVVPMQNGERYRLLEPIRQFAVAKARESGRLPTLSLRHAQYYLRIVEAVSENLSGHGQATTLDLLDTEVANLRTAMTWTRLSNDLDAALRWGIALWRYWYMRGRLREGLDWLDPWLDDPRIAGHETATVAAARHAAGTLSLYRGRPIQAVRWLRQSLETRQELGDEKGIASTLMNLGAAAAERGDLREAATHFEASLAIKSSLGDRVGLATALVNLARIELDLGALQRSATHAGGALGIYEAEGDIHGASLARITLAVGQIVSGNCESATKLLRRCLADKQNDEHRHLLSDLHRHLGVALHYCGKLEEAEFQLRRARSMAAECGQQHRALLCDVHLGELRLNLQAEAPCLDGADLLVNAMRSRGYRGGLADALLLRARIAGVLNAKLRMSADLDECLGLRRDMDDVMGIVQVAEHVAWLHAIEGRNGRAINLLYAADCKRTEIGAPRPSHENDLVNAWALECANYLGNAAVEIARNRMAADDVDLLLSEWGEL